MSTPSHELAVISSGLATLKAKIGAMVVRNADDYRAILEEVDAGTRYIKDVQSKLGPGIESARLHLQTLRNQMNAYIEPAQIIVDAGKKKASDWKAEEKRQAQLEADRISAAEKKRLDEQAEADRKAREKEIEKQRKAGDLSKKEAAKLTAAAVAEEAAVKAAPPPAVTVTPAVPKVAGHADRTVWKWRMKQIDAVPRMFLYPNDLNDCSNYPRITVEVKRIKDKAKAEAAIPGIEVYSEEGV